MKFAKLVAATALAFAAPAFAQDANVAVGDTVFGPQGNEVGVVDSIQDGFVRLNTGNNIGTLPVDAFGKNEKGPVISMTKVDLDAAIDAAEAEAEAALAAKLVAGTQVYSADGVMLGTVKEMGEAEGQVVIELADHGPVTLMTEQMIVTNDQLIFRATKAQLDAALQG